MTGAPACPKPCRACHLRTVGIQKRKKKASRLPTAARCCNEGFTCFILNRAVQTPSEQSGRHANFLKSSTHEIEGPTGRRRHVDGPVATAQALGLLHGLSGFRSPWAEGCLKEQVRMRRKPLQSQKHRDACRTMRIAAVVLSLCELGNFNLYGHRLSQVVIAAANHWRDYGRMSDFSCWQQQLRHPQQPQCFCRSAQTHVVWRTSRTFSVMPAIFQIVIIVSFFMFVCPFRTVIIIITTIINGFTVQLDHVLP